MNILTTTKQTALALAALVALGISAQAEPYAPPPIPGESALIGTLQSPTASDNAKVTAAQQLGNVGTHAAIAPLVALLDSDKAYLRDAARYGLENNPCPSVETTLVAAAERLRGPARVGVVQSIGIRGNAQSVPLLAKLVTDSDAALAKAAADSLGKLAIPEAFAALKPGLGKCPNAAVAYLRGADRVFQKNPKAAANYYADILKGGKTTSDYALFSPRPNIPPAVHQAALLGYMLSEDDEGIFCSSWFDCLRSKNPGIVDVALRCITEYRASPSVTRSIAGILGNDELPEGTRAKVAEALAVRGDKAAVQNLTMFAHGLRNGAYRSPSVAPEVPAADEADRLARAKALHRVGTTSHGGSEGDTKELERLLATPEGKKSFREFAYRLTTPDAEAARLAAAKALVALGSPDVARPILETLLAAPAPAVSTGAQEALRGLSYQTPAEEAALGFKSMFNGKDMTEWRGGDNWWRVEKGLLTAQSTPEKPCKKNSQLIWNGGEKADFEIRAEFRLSHEANSGIQFRAENKNADTSYQADMDGADGYIGFLYLPGFHLVGNRGAKVVLPAKGKKIVTPLPHGKVLKKGFFRAGWNEYSIIANGNRITLYVNGIKTNDFEDRRPNAPKKGFITLQMHQGPPMKIEFRNMRIREL